MVIQFMIQGCPFLYQATNGTVYHVHEKGVQAIESWLSNEKIVAFVDGDKEDHQPDDMLMAHEVQIVLASPPKGAHQQWMKQKPGGTVLATKLWSAHELFLTGFVLGLLHSALD